MRKTNPISPRRRRLTEEIVQNEAKFGWTGVCRQRLSCGAWLGRGAECAKRTQFQRGVSSLKFQVSSRNAPAAGPPASNFKPQTSHFPNRAKQTHFAPRRREAKLFVERELRKM
jgi:hypothetical protein